MIYQYQVSFSDVDYARVLFFGRFYEVVNRAWEHWFHQYGIYFRDLAEQHNLRIPIVASFCRYLGAARLEDVLEVHMGVKDLSPRGCTMVFVFFRQGQERPLTWGYLERRFVNVAGEACDASEAVLSMLRTMADESAGFIQEVWEPLAQRRK